MRASSLTSRSVAKSPRRRATFNPDPGVNAGGIFFLLSSVQRENTAIHVHSVTAVSLACSGAAVGVCGCTFAAGGWALVPTVRSLVAITFTIYSSTTYFMVVKKTSPSEGSAGICPVPLLIDSYFKNFNPCFL